ncbi:MAG TPA: histidine kinase [Longimicrobiales bacterium]
MGASHTARLGARSLIPLIFLGWSLYGFVLLSQSVLWWVAVDRRPALWFAPVIYAFVIVWTWASLTPAIMWMARRFPLWPRSLRAWTTHAAAALAVTVITALVEIGIGNALPGGTNARLVLTYVDRFDVSFFFYAGTVAFTLAIDHARVARERQLASARLEAELTNAQLRTLRMQIQPHFLFNALNTISSLMQRDTEAADRMISRLGELLRLTLEERDSAESTLRRELEVVRRYAEIEQVRFDEWLTLELAIDDDVLDARVPGMLLQPLIENAIRHGIAPLGRPGRVALRAARDRDELVITVQDDGVGVPAHGVRFGIGLGTTAERLEALYGDRQKLVIEPVDPTGTRVTLRIPLVTAPSRPTHTPTPPPFADAHVVS